MKASIAIARDFRERIARGELAAGQPLPVESDLVDELGVSKGVVREALRILENEGLVEVRRGLGGGPRVRHPSIAEAAAQVGVYLQIGDVVVGDVWRSRDRMIATAVEAVAASGPPEAADRLDAAVDALEAVVGDLDAYYVELLALGEIAVELSGSRTDHALVGALRHIVAAGLEEATRTAVDEGDLERAVEAERAIARAWRDVARHVRGRRPAAARRCFESQADLILGGYLLQRVDAETVVDVFGGGRMPG